MIKKDKELKKRDAIVTCKQIINMDKYNVIGHETGKVTWIDKENGTYSTTIERPPKGTTNILVIYLKQ